MAIALYRSYRWYLGTSNFSRFNRCMAIEDSLQSSGSRGLESKQSEVNAKREELARGEAGGAMGWSLMFHWRNFHLIIWYSTYMTWYIYIYIYYIIYIFIILYYIMLYYIIYMDSSQIFDWFLICLFEEIQKHLTRQLREEKQEAGTAGKDEWLKRTSRHWSCFFFLVENSCVFLVTHFCSDSSIAIGSLKPKTKGIMQMTIIFSRQC